MRGPVCTLLVCTGALVATGALRAQSLDAQSLDAHAGDWVWTADDAERQSIATSIDGAVSGMNVLSANVARMRLALANEPPARLSLRFDADETVLSLDDTEVHVPSHGSARTLGPGGERGRASQEVVDHELRLHFASMRGTRHITLAVRNDRLIMTVRIESAHLGRDVRYTLTYRRA